MDTQKIKETGKFILFLLLIVAFITDTRKSIRRLRHDRRRRYHTYENPCIDTTNLSRSSGGIIVMHEGRKSITHEEIDKWLQKQRENYPELKWEFGSWLAKDWWVAHYNYYRYDASCPAVSVTGVETHELLGLADSGLQELNTNEVMAYNNMDGKCYFVDASPWNNFDVTDDSRMLKAKIYGKEK